MSNGVKGRLIIIGGHEDKEGDQTILKEVAESVGKGLAIVTVATGKPEELVQEYRPVFRKLGIRKIIPVDVRNHEDGHNPELIEKLQKTDVVFFTGGDQLRITSQFSDSPLYNCLAEMYAKGAVVAGTSAGAAALPQTMLISGDGDKSGEISAIGMAPGLGLIENVVIDSHFAERGRIGRLLGAVAQNPRNLGLGIDENTAIVVEKNGRFRVLGSGAVCVIDGSPITYSSLSEEHPEGVLSIYDVKLHILAQDDQFDLAQRKPLAAQSSQKSNGPWTCPDSVEEKLRDRYTESRSRRQWQTSEESTAKSSSAKQSS